MATFTAVLASGELLRVDLPSGEALLFTMQSRGLPAPVLHATGLALGERPDLLMLDDDGTHRRRLLPTVVAVMDGSAGWVWLDGWPRRPDVPEPRQPGWWVMVTQDADLVVVDRGGAQVTIIESPGRAPSLDALERDRRVAGGSTQMWIVGEAGFRKAGDPVLVNLGDLEQDPDAAAMISEFGRRSDRGFAKVGVLAGAPVFMPYSRDADYRDWFGELADLETLPPATP